MQALQFFEILGTICPCDTVSHPQGLKSWATPLREPQILWGDFRLCDRRFLQLCMKMRVTWDANVQKVPTFQRKLCLHLQCRICHPKTSIFLYHTAGLYIPDECNTDWLMVSENMVLRDATVSGPGMAYPYTVTCLPSADFGNGGSKSGMSSADRPSTLSTTDFGRSLRPCRLFRFVERWGVACAWMDVIKESDTNIWQNSSHRHKLTSNVYWTVHHCNSWRMKDQLDDTCYFISLIMCSTCFRH